MAARLVLDTDVYGYGRIGELERLALRGLSISVSEIAFAEAWAKSVREYRAGMLRERARGKLFGRTRSLAPYVDAQHPVALGAGGITHLGLTDRALAHSGPFTARAAADSPTWLRWHVTCFLGASMQRFLLPLLLAAFTAACDSSSSAAGSACSSAAGTCVLGGHPCAQQAVSSAQDCNPTENPGGAFCCVALADGGESNGARGDAGTTDAVSTPTLCIDAGPVGSCQDADIKASSYDQTCQTDSDCVPVGEGQSCYPCSLAYGPYGAISRGVLTQFEADVAKTPGGAGTPVSCGTACTPSPIACCRAGQCRADALCSGDAGGQD